MASPQRGHSGISGHFRTFPDTGVDDRCTINQPVARDDTRIGRP